ncbi:MAG: BrnT family toxin [Gloeotrichia echinulata GP01]
MPEYCFEWDENKNTTNIGKHGIDFREASKIFYDNCRLTFPDTRQDYGELREISIGEINLSLDNSIIILVVVHTDRDGSIRIISARKANKKERTIYAQRKNIFG